MPAGGRGQLDEDEVMVVALDTGEVLSTHRTNPTRGYWRNGPPGGIRTPDLLIRSQSL